MTPVEFFALMLLVTAVAAAARTLVRKRHVNELRRLALEWKLHYSADDRFRLAARLAGRLPTIGAAGVHIVDLLYGIEDQNYRYVFAAEYTTGVLRTKTSLRRVGSFVEPREPSAEKRVAGELIFAPEHLPVVEQYRHLLQMKREEMKHET